MKFTMGKEAQASMAMHRDMWARGEISLTEYSNMNRLLFFIYMSSPFGS